MTTLLTENDIVYLHSILNHLRDFKTVIEEIPPALSIGTEALNDNIDWLDCWLEAQPISRLRIEFQKASALLLDTQTELFTAKEQVQLARHSVDSLKHLQKYEGMQKIDSDVSGYQASEKLLRQEIDRLNLEIARLGGV